MPVTIRKRVTIFGVVQGVGFRPFIYGLAHDNQLAGFVANNDGRVIVEVQGTSDRIERFMTELPVRLPPLARITEMTIDDVAPCSSETGFVIEKSTTSDHSGLKFVAADTATCHDCLGELFDPSNRRYRYPFTNCTNCGPRFTIINSLPYDRPSTTMSSFPMCQLCRAEYEDASDRRFHAQPNACHACGPRLKWTGADGLAQGEEALQNALVNLNDSKIVAVKGLGGFHLMVDATLPAAIERLRQRKMRARKPFALMMGDLDQVRRYCRVSDYEAKKLAEPTRAVVLLERLDSCDLPSEIAPGLNRIGVMLPYTPLHYIMLQDYNRPLIATSGNVSEEPIAINNEDAHNRLANIADGFLEHDREICSRYDDSVVQYFEEQSILIRRSRGIAPASLPMAFTSQRRILACGGHLKNTFCLLRDDQAYISHHIGDLASIESYEHFHETLSTYVRLFDLSFDAIAVDYHPDYLSTSIGESLAKEHGVPLIPVQHHHAHIASCMAENGLTGKVIGVAFDGSGYGDDGTIWGGEFLVSSFHEYKRAAHFAPVPLPGGNIAMKEPWRMALSYVIEGCNFGDHFIDNVQRRLGTKVVSLVARQIRQRISSPLTSSCGRLFDAMSALLGICDRAEYEGQAAMELESIARTAIDTMNASDGSVYQYELIEKGQGATVVHPGGILQNAYQDKLNGIPLALISLKFHHTLALLVGDVCDRIRTKNLLNRICLSGGVFQNKLLLSLLLELLPQRGFEVFIQQKVPANDGGLSLGQAAVALARLNAMTVHDHRKA